MTFLPHTQKALAEDGALKPALRQDLRALGERALPLQQALRQSSIPLADELDVMILDCHGSDEGWNIRCTVFFHGIVAGCQCADDPGPEQRIDESARLHIRLSLSDGYARIQLDDDD